MPPTTPQASIWAQGSRTVRQAQAETGLSRDALFALMRAGVLAWKRAPGGRGTRLIAWASVVAYLESLPTETEATGANAHTGVS